jgi:hypothetical protein
MKGDRSNGYTWVITRMNESMTHGIASRIILYLENRDYPPTPNSLLTQLVPGRSANVVVRR